MNRPPKGDEYRRGNASWMMFQPTAADVPNMQIRIRSGTFWVNGQTLVEYNGGMSPTITAPKSGAKWVVVVINKLGTALIVDGISRSNNPEVPELSKNLLPIAMIYVKSSTKAISNDMIYDVRPNLAVGGYPYQHNQLQKREEANAHGIAAITGLTEALENKLSVNEANALLAQKADAIGTTASTFSLNRDETGTPVEYCGIRVIRGDLPPVGIRFNEDVDEWEFTNDGTNWRAITSKTAIIPLANSYTKGVVQLTADPEDENVPIAVAANDPLYLSIANKVSYADLTAMAPVTAKTLEEALAKKADLDAVYTRYDAETIFITRAEYQTGNDGFTKAQINEMLALKANRSEVEAALSKIYTKQEVDNLLAGLDTGSGNGSGNDNNGNNNNGHNCGLLINYYTKLETDLLMANKYSKAEVDNLLSNKVDNSTIRSLLTTKANVSDVYTKAEVDALVAKGGGGNNNGSGTVVDTYTKGEVDSLLAGKAAVTHAHVATDIVQDNVHRFVTDDQITAWNNKQDALGFIPVNSTKLGVGGGVATLDSNGKVPLSQLPTSILGGGGDFTVLQTGALVLENYSKLAEVDSPTSGQLAFVVDASADETVESGWALYVYDNTGAWRKLSEQEGLDLICDWSNIQNKPDNLLTTDSADYTNLAKKNDVYTKVEVDNLLTAKADVVHDHDDRYLTTEQVNALLRDKVDNSAFDVSKMHDPTQLGTHEVDESAIGDGKVLAFSAATGKLVYVDQVAGDGSGSTSNDFKLGTKMIDESDIGDDKALVYSQSKDKLVYKTLDVGKVGTLDVDESALGNNKILVYSTTTGKLEYRNQSTFGTHEIDESNIGDGRVLAYSSATNKLVYIDQTAGGNGSSSSGTCQSQVVFEPASSTNGECLICASSNDVSFVKNGTSIAFTPGADVKIYWVRFRLTESEMASTTQASVDLDTTSSVDYAFMRVPIVTIISDDENNRTLVKNIAVNYNTNAHTVNLTGMAHRGYLVRIDY